MIKIASPDLAKLSRRLATVASDSPIAFRQATQSVQRASNTETKRAAAAIYNLPQKRIADDVTVTSDAASNVRIRARKRPPTLAAYGGRMTRRGYSVTVFKERGRIVLGRKVFAPQKFGNVPFERRGKERLPIDVLYGPSAADMLNNPKVFTPLQERLILRARTELDRRITRALRG